MWRVLIERHPFSAILHDANSFDESEGKMVFQQSIITDLFNSLQPLFRWRRQGEGGLAPPPTFQKVGPRLSTKSNEKIF